jgi:acetyl-CoA carboxylase carboxyl transferase alpha subunit/acetyl-CoA carboxylase carboxyl transferase beta subunit
LRALKNTHQPRSSPGHKEDKASEIPVGDSGDKSFRRTRERITDWVKCPRCGWLHYAKRLVRNLRVCSECGYHFRLTARERIAQLADVDSFAECGIDIGAADPLGFIDRRPYSERLVQAIGTTGEREAVVFGTATVEGYPMVLAVMDFGFMGASMGSAAGEAVTRAAETAFEQRRPLVVVCTSGGARMQEGVISLLQMVKTSQALARLHEAGVLSVCILSDPTFGGVTASFAMLGAVVIAEPGALVGFAGPRVIEQTIRQKLPAGFQTSEFLFRHGLIDQVENRTELRSLLARLLALHAPGKAQAPGQVEERSSAGELSAVHLRSDDAWEVVQAARHIERPTALDYLRDAFEEFVELHGDRCCGDDPAIVGGLARIGGLPVVVVAHQKAHSTKQLVARNFGMPHPEGYRKVLRLLDHAERFGMPVVTLVDTPGAYPGVEAEERGQAGAIAQVIMRSARLRVPIVCVLTGEGGSGGALALATGDRLLMLENSFFSVISPEGCAAILWRTADAAPAAARALRVTARDLVALSIVDTVIPEPPGGARADNLIAAGNLRRGVMEALAELTAVDVPSLLTARYERFRQVGVAVSTTPQERERSA